MFINKNISNISNIYNVSRETINNLNIYRSLLLRNNQKFNLISKSTEKDIDYRHMLDSSQIIDLIGKNDEVCADIGSGAGLPGIILAILAKDRNLPTRIDLYEKSPKKCIFLKEVIKKIGLNASVLETDITKEKNLIANIIVARAFKPIQEIFKVVTQNFDNFDNLVLFMGKNGKSTLLDASKVWEFEYKEKRSITNEDSFVIEIKQVKKFW